MEVAIKDHFTKSLNQPVGIVILLIRGQKVIEISKNTLRQCRLISNDTNEFSRIPYFVSFRMALISSETPGG